MTARLPHIIGKSLQRIQIDGWCFSWEAGCAGTKRRVRIAGKMIRAQITWPCHLLISLILFPCLVFSRRTRKNHQCGMPIRHFYIIAHQISIWESLVDQAKPLICGAWNLGGRQMLGPWSIIWWGIRAWVVIKYNKLYCSVVHRPVVLGRWIFWIKWPTLWDLTTFARLATWTPRCTWTC